MFVALVAAALPFLAVPQAHAAGSAYYVDCQSTAPAQGTQSQPFTTLAQVNALVLQPGDQVLFKRGTACHGTLAPQGSGTPGSPISVDAYGSGPKPLIAGDGAPNAVHLRNVQQWEVRNLEVTNTGATAGNRRGVYLELRDFGAGTHYRIENLTVHDVNGDMKKDTNGSSGIHLDTLGSAVPSRFEDVVLDGNEVYTVDRSGINMSSDWWCRPAVGCSSGQPYHPWGKVTIRNSTVHDIGGDGVVLQYTTGGLAEHNVLYDINMRAGQLNNAGLWVWNAEHATFQHNEVYRVRRPAGTNDGNAFDADYGTVGTLYQYNYSHDNEGGMILFCGCGGTSDGTVVRYNISQNDKSRIIMAAGATNSAFYNNTIYIPKGYSTKIVEEYSSATYLRLFNNLIVNEGRGGYQLTQANYTWSNNLFAGRHPANEPADPYKVTADPRLVAVGTGPSGYKLTAGSPAIGAGRPIPDNGGFDYFGGPVSATCAPDIGAHQLGTACTVPPVLANGGFESGLAPWAPWNSASVVTTDVRSGAAALRVGPAEASAEQVITVAPGRTYTLTGWGKVATAGEQLMIGVKGYGGAEVRQTLTATAYGQATVTFTPTGSTATAYCYKATGAGNGYCDDLTVT